MAYRHDDAEACVFNWIKILVLAGITSTQPCLLRHHPRVWSKESGCLILSNYRAYSLL